MRYLSIELKKMMLFRKYKRDIHCNAINNYHGISLNSIPKLFSVLLIYILTCYDDTQFYLKKFIAAMSFKVQDILRLPFKVTFKHVRLKNRNS